MFLAGCCYGFLVPLVRVAGDEGFSTGQMMVTQYIYTLAILFVVTVAFIRARIRVRQVFQLIALGVLLSSVSLFYYNALQMLPSSTALTLLFQFSWIGVVIQIIMERKPPRPIVIVAVVVIFVGTFFATGILPAGAGVLQGLNVVGVLCGLAAAVTYAIYITVSGRFAKGVPALERSMFTSIGNFILGFIVCPTYFATSTFIDLGWLGFALGFVGILLPLVLIAISSPHLSAGTSTIMAASELPAGIICAAAIMGDAISVTVVLGVVLVLVGIVMSQVRLPLQGKTGDTGIR
jgi:drug/metabolite transporter (DMT)-like permease